MSFKWLKSRPRKNKKMGPRTNSCPPRRENKSHRKRCKGTSCEAARCNCRILQYVPGQTARRTSPCKGGYTLNRGVTRQRKRVPDTTSATPYKTRWAWRASMRSSPLGVHLVVVIFRMTLPFFWFLKMMDAHVCAPTIMHWIRKLQRIDVLCR